MKTPKIKIFVDAHCFDTEYQGTRTFLKGIYNILAQKGDVHIYLGALDIDNLKTHFPRSENISYLQYKNNFRLFRLAVDIPSLISKNHIDYAHFQYITPFQKRSKQIVTIHDILFAEYPEAFPLLYRLQRRYLFQRSCRASDIVTTVSGYSKMSIEKHFNIYGKSVHLIPNGVGSSFFEPFQKKLAKEFIYRKYGFTKMLLCVSRIEPRKNHILLLRSFLDLKLYDKGYHLIIIGHQSIQVPAFTAILNALDEKIRNYISIIKQVNDQDLLQFYRAAELFVYPSGAEGFGIPPLEAAATGAPVICSNATAMRDFTFFEKDHVDPLDTERLNSRI
ncbi:MAG TPA: glycosyltransferase family 1 protein, partial [Flavitalea sp.]|nr:glycosyltransferase family 1 protein [Flavitalea sp.]